MARATLCVVRGCGVWSSCLLHCSETQSYFKTAVCALPGEVTYPVAVGEKSLELPLYRDVTFVTTALSSFSFTTQWCSSLEFKPIQQASHPFTAP